MEDIPDLTKLQREDNIEGDNSEVPDQLPQQTAQTLNIPTVVEDPIEKRKVILKVRRWLLEFEKHLGDFTNRDLEALSIEQLDILLREIKFTVSCRNVNTMSIRAFKTMIVNIEYFCCTHTQIRCAGLSKLNEDEDLLDCVKEFSLENMELFYTKPQYRILYAVVSSIMTLHIVNSTREKEQLALQAQQAKKEVDLEKVKEIDAEFDKIDEKSAENKIINSSNKINSVKIV